MNARLDQILIRLGYATEEQIQQALRRQKTHGGRFGSHLLYFKSLTEEQLAEALSIQHEIPCYDNRIHNVRPELVADFPKAAAIEHLVLPLFRNDEEDEIVAVVADPEDTAPLAAIRRAFACSNVTRLVAPETTVRELISSNYRGSEPEGISEQLIELPELFDDDSRSRGGSSDLAGRAAGATDCEGHVLLVSRAMFLRNFLCPIFEREGYNLHVAFDEPEIEQVLQLTPPEYILVTEDSGEAFRSFLSKSGTHIQTAEISEFTSVAETLLANPIPYRQVARSLLRALHIIAEVRGSDHARTPPYDLICRDLEALCASLGLRRLATDGVQIATLLVLPVFDDTPGARVTLRDFDRTIDYARSLRFPWDIDNVLRLFSALMTGESPIGKFEKPKAETAVAAQAMALVWHRHALSTLAAIQGESSTELKTALREQSGLIAETDVIESYIRILDGMAEIPGGGGQKQLFVIGHFGSVADQFATRLKHSGYRPVRIDDVDEAKTMCKRLSPTAILIHDESYPDEVFDLKARFSGPAPMLFYAIAQEGNPSRILDLFDAGFDDVFTPPFDFDIVAARIGKSIKTLSTVDSATLKPGGFRASLKAFAFLDLVQALGQSRKSVRITVDSADGLRARIFMRDGRLVHAVSGNRSGVDVIYDVITWKEDGSFVVEPETRYPDDNISDGNEAILMEGCRLLDESNV